MYTLDTNAIIYYLKGDEHAIKIITESLKNPLPIYISTITETELFGFSNLTTDDSTAIETLLTAFAKIPVDSTIARTAGFLRRRYKIKIPDSIIAATALFTGTTLVTRNVTDFKSIERLSIQKI